MIPEIGHFALILALCLAAVQGTLPIIGAARGNAAWMALARPVSQGQLAFIAVAYAALTYSFIVNDFSVLYVASQSNSHLPLLYRISGVWGGHEGSLLLWILMLSMWTVAVTLFSKRLPDEMLARVVGVMGLVSVGFISFILFTSDPFERLLPAAPDGRDLNPLLQDPGLAIHPPMLYMGYVGFSVAFAFAIAALLGGRLDAAWARWSRPWTTVAWMFLTIGIALGSWWAYYEQGWGGWWFWDSVENASFMPWLVGTALIHSLAVTEKRGSFKSWTVLLAICAFSLSLLGTFLVRSGVLNSVHSFASDPQRGLFILIFLVIVVGGSLALYAWRAPKVGLGGRFDVVSRESMLLANNVLFTVAAATVLLGTLAPLFVDAFVALGIMEKANKISVGAPYFNTMFVFQMVFVAFLMGVGPVARWKTASVPELAVRLKWAFASSVAVALLLPFVMGHWSWLVSLGLWMALWVLFTVVQGVWQRVARTPGGGDWLGRLFKQPNSYLGMQLAHFGVAVFIIGVTLVGGYELEKDVRMDIGDSVELGGYTFRFDGATAVRGPNYEASRGIFVVTQSDEPVTTLYPEKRVYKVQRQPMTEAGIDSGFLRHLFVALGDPLGNGAWSVRLYVKPFVTWIWLGCGLMALGGLLAISDKRYRVLSRKQRRARGVVAASPGGKVAPAPSPSMSRAEVGS
ncbi:MAG TPA: heme lyase CcmF/NrfE family subunit [Gammaproteobacteria bacterium]|nr:heme lyase CcmF/NrfE family subunit [Gammaproteobacteria bacterium]